MPRKSDITPINNSELDRRVKLQEPQKKAIKELYESGSMSITKLAHIYNVNKRLIQFILFPERKIKNLELRQQRGGSKIYYDREKHTKAIKEHRDYKKQIFSKLQTNEISNKKEKKNK